MGFYRGPNIVTDGLVFAIDAGSKRSFNVMPTTVEALVIAGGGGGGVGSNAGGGGGAGGVIHNTSYSLSSTTSFTVTVGAGGAGKTGRGSGTNGANSVFGTLTAVGGGRGGGHPQGGGSVSPNTGGSGGGGSYSTAGATGTSGQGFAGGNGAQFASKPTPNDGGGGGGGAGAVGVAAQGSGGPGGNGGAGATYSTSGFPVIYAGGGGGATNNSNLMSAGGTGGGGAGASKLGGPSISGFAGLVNSGSGGGAGNGGGGNSGAGGSGVVIIKYLGIQKATGGTVTTVNGYTIHTFTSSGTFLLVDFAVSLVGSHLPTLKNGVGFSSGNAGAFTFDGVDQYIEIPYSTELDPTAGITFDAWVYPTNITTNQFYEIYRKENASARHLFAFQNNGTILAFGTHTSISGYNELDVSITASDFVNKWSHVVASYQSGSKVIYVNGQSIGSTTGITGTLVQAVAPQILGSNGGGNEFFQGNYPSFKMYNRAISATEVLQNYNAQKSRYGL